MQAEDNRFNEKNYVVQIDDICKTNEKIPKSDTRRFQ